MIETGLDPAYNPSFVSMDLSRLNPEQRAAVEHRGSPLLVLAGAGSGKTRVITARIAHLLANHETQPENILAVTFTNRAAAEMKERVGRLVGEKSAKALQVSTFHSFCAGVLRKEIESLGYSKRFTIYDASDQRALLARCLSEFSTGKEAFDVGFFSYRISRAKNRGLAPDTYEPFRYDKYDELLPALWSKYQQALRARDAVDFDDLLGLVNRLLTENPEALARLRERHHHLLIDEYQDTNALQFEIARKLALEHRNLCVVGDDDQSIYGWRGAETANILEFERAFPDARAITLDRNYRSTETILRAANAVIARNSERRAKNLWSKEGAGWKIDLVTATDENDEASCVAARIKEVRARFNLAWSDFGVLYRSNIQSRPFEILFRQLRIPYVVIGGMEFFDRKEVKDIASYLRVLANPRDDIALRRILNVPRRGIGDTALERLNEAAAARGKPLMEALRGASRLNLPDSARAGIEEFLRLLAGTQAALREKGLGAGILHLIHHSGYLEELEKTSPSQAAYEARKEITLEMAGAAEGYAREHPKANLLEFLQEASLADDFRRNLKEKKFEEDTVRLMTLHAAKGLEFPVVFIVGLEEGLLPHARAIAPATDVAEERRLFYVGMTRARKHLTLTTTATRTVRGRTKASVESRFLEELPSECLRYQMSNQRVLEEEDTFPAPNFVTSVSP
ncbi:MAG: ATP-dependent DNA helicase PcrA [bacterium]|nr:ATP-dependent DNA helicase PcrA [bacterium]